MRRGDVVENERPVRHVIDCDRKPLLEHRLDQRGHIGVVVGYEDALHTTNRSARTRRKIRSFMQSLQWHMATRLCTGHASDGPTASG